MLTISQKNLLKLANGSLDKHNNSKAIEYLIEAINLGYDQSILLKLVDVYLKNKESDQAYLLIKEEPDLFSDKKVFNLYLKTLQANNYVIEALQVAHLKEINLPIKIEAVSDAEQQSIMNNFKHQKIITLAAYQKLYKLSRANFILFAKSLLIDPSIEFAIRMALCEDLIKLGVEEKIPVLILGKLTQFVPKNTLLLRKNKIYQEVSQSVYDRLQHSPDKLTTYLAEVNLVLGALFPKVNDYINNPDRFASDFLSYIEKGDGGIDQELLEKIYKTLPNKK